MSPAFQAWARLLKERPGHLHRKVWEWCFICQALAERGMLESGRRGLGFAVGQEPLAALFAARGAQVTATDLYSEAAAANGWIQTGQHADGYSALNARDICDPAVLRERLDFRFADMNDVGEEFTGGYDFTWSACAFEHLGDLEAGMRFVLESMRCLKPGGVAVHTTEFNVSSNDATVEKGSTVIYRQRDIEELAARLRAAGYDIDIDWEMGESVADGYIDMPPYLHDPHLKLALGGYTITSIGLIIRKPRFHRWQRLVRSWGRDAA